MVLFSTNPAFCHSHTLTFSQGERRLGAIFDKLTMLSESSESGDLEPNKLFFCASIHLWTS